MIKLLRLENGTELPLPSDFSGQLGAGISELLLPVNLFPNGYFRDSHHCVFSLSGLGPLPRPEVEELLDAVLRGIKERIATFETPSPAQELHELMQRPNWTAQESNRVRVLYAMIEKEKI